jgi:hypothetical protein
MSQVTEYIDTAQQSAAELADRYVAVWNEVDPERRRRMIAELWTEDGWHLLQPPEEARRIAAGPGVGGSAIIEARGHAEIEVRATSGYEQWVAGEKWSFRRRDDAERVHDVVKFHWEAVNEDGEVTGVGLNVLVLAGDGRIERDYTFVVG